MSDTRASSHRHRQPLSDRTLADANPRLQSNQNPKSKHVTVKRPSSNHDSPQGNGDLSLVQNTPQNPRLSAISDEASGEIKRLSQTSSSSGGSAGRKLKTHVGPWQLGKSLGHGMSGRVRKARHSETSELAAVKIISILQASKMQTASILDIESRAKKSPATREDKIPMVLKREITILKTIEHPNIIRLFDVWENRGEIYMFMELVEGGELFDHIKRQRLEEDEVARLFRQIISGLQYCHRFRLCHRDLKPENILLDRMGNVKLADFGMAAMHQGKYLYTACGSPHYAAPEVCRGQQYSGDLADTWSSGVVLYVMLFEALPFGSHCGADDIKTIVQEVQRKKIEFPKDRKDISQEAKDFVLAVLQREPGKRLTIAKMWEHPWLTYYDNYAAQPENQPYWLGGPLPSLTMADCGPPIKTPSEIDRNIVRMLCTLWHTDDEKRFAKALTDPHASYEKVLYHNLKKFRTEQEETYMAPNLASSASDYHHVSKALQRSVTRGSLLGSISTDSQQRSISRYSIVPPGSRQPSTRSSRSNGSHRTGSVAATEATYDPFRSSRPQVTYQGTSYTRVDVLRGNSVTSKGTSSTREASTRGPPPVQRRIPESSVWESTIASSVNSIPSSPPLPRDEHGRTRSIRHTGPVKRVLSSSSFASTVSRVNSSTGACFVKSSSFKRQVSFVNKRQKMQPPARPSNPNPTSLGQSLLCNEIPQEHSDEASQLASTPQAITGHHSLPEMKKDCDYTPDSLRETSKTVNGASIARNTLPTPQELALRASSELGVYCDEVFGPSPVPISSDPARPMTPNEALAARLYSNTTPSKASNLREELHRRPLPDPPIREPHALQVQSELAKMHRYLMAKEKELGPGMMKEALDALEKLMRTNAPLITAANYERRVASAPTPDREQPQDGGGLITDKQGRRVFSAPLPQPLYGPELSCDGGPTIRFVPPSSPCGPPQSPYDDDSDVNRTDNGVAAAPFERLKEPRIVPRRKGSREYLAAPDTANTRGSMTLSMYESRLHTIEEDREREIEVADEAPKRGSAGSMMKSLFRRNTRSIRSIKSFDQRDSQTSPSPRPLSDQASIREQTSDQAPANTLAHGRPPSRMTAWQDQVHDAMILPVPSPSLAQTYASSEFPTRHEPPARPSSAAVSSYAPDVVAKKTGGNWFKSMFKRDRPSNMAVIEPSETSSIGQLSNIRPTSASSRRPPQRMSNSSPYPTLINRNIPTFEPQNWFARLLQVKPAHKTLVFEVNRTHVLKEIRSIFRDWKRFGVRDIVIDKHVGRIWATLDADNSLGVKSVEIVVQVYAVIYTANKKPRNAGGMCIARMEQVKGAKSSFECCAQQMQRVCRERKLLVVDYDKEKEMKKVLKDFMK